MIIRGTRVLDPIWRQQPGPAGVGYVAFDPLDAEFALRNGKVVVDGKHFHCDLIGANDGMVEKDGRVSVRVQFA